MAIYGFIGEVGPQEEGDNKGIFDTGDIIELMSENVWQRFNVTYLVIGGGGGGGGPSGNGSGTGGGGAGGYRNSFGSESSGGAGGSDTETPINIPKMQV